MTALLHLELLHKNKPQRKHIPDQAGYPFQKLIEGILSGYGFKSFTADFRFSPQRDAYMLDIVGNTVCADLLDYAKRDSHFANLKLDYDAERIAENFTLISWNAVTYPGGKGDDCRDAGVPGDPFGCPCIRTAIGLFSHKLRTDVLGELMNLLNVRFYLYERVIFNPTKCAADAMLGAALQLLGWRPLLSGENNKSELLPERLRHVGDAAFLDHVIQAARIALAAPRFWEGDDRSRTLDDIPDLLPVELARTLVMRRTAPTAAKIDLAAAKAEIRAGLVLLQRLKARRYYRPVFRMLPNAEDGQFDIAVKLLAETFRDAETRFRVEREIERTAVPPMPPGSVVIHCPERSTARKVANVLVAGPTKDAREMVRKLCHIKEIDPKVFGEHQKATAAVSEMYGSMWRLVVYVAPQYIENYKAIATAAGAAIVENLPNHKREQRPWRNDPNLVRELELRLADHAKAVDTQIGEADTSERAGIILEALAELGEESGSPIIRELLDDGVSKESTRALLAQFLQPKIEDGNRASRITLFLRSTPYVPPTGLAEAVSDWSDSHMASLSDEQFQSYFVRMKKIASFTPTDLIAARTGQQTRASEVTDFLTEALSSWGT
jgi:hypothetical protein